MIKINGYWYSYDEVKEALEKKGYTIVLEEYEPDKHGDVKNEWKAIKDGKEENMQSVALREFHKKPQLI